MVGFNDRWFCDCNRNWRYPIGCFTGFICPAEFFAQPLKYKKTCMAKDRARRGYSCINSENFASLVGSIANNDLVEKYRFGPENTLPSNGKSPNLQQNQWPSASADSTDFDEAKFEENVKLYYSELEIFSNHLLAAIGLAFRDATGLDVTSDLDLFPLPPKRKIGLHFGSATRTENFNFDVERLSCNS